MSGKDRDPSILRHLRSLNDSAIRSYYTYVVLTKLLRSQDKSLSEEIAVPVGIAASVVSIFVFLQIPASRDLVLIAYGIVIAVMLVVPNVQRYRRYRKKNGLDDVTYLAIYFDDVFG